MKLRVVTIPLGCLLACLGGLVWIQAKARSETPYSDSVNIITSQPRHLITAQMLTETEAMHNALEKNFKVADVKGSVIELASTTAPRPQFVYFVVDGCPCSFDAEPLFHDLYKRFKGKVDFVSVTNGDLKKATLWNTELSVPYPVIPDPKEEIIHAYGAKAAIYCTMIAKNGHIAKMWPGYSKDLLLEMNHEMAKIAGVPEQPFDTKYAPLTKATGCAFTNVDLK